MYFWTEQNCKGWRVEFTNMWGDKQKKVLPIKKEQSIETAKRYFIPIAANHYFLYLHKNLNMWERYHIRGSSLKEMYLEMVEFHEYYLINEFKYDLKKIGIVPKTTSSYASNKGFFKTKKTYKYKNKHHTIEALSNLYDVPVKTILMRLNRGWDIVKAVETKTYTKSEAGIKGADKRW